MQPLRHFLSTGGPTFKSMLRSTRRARFFRPSLETLEDRRVLSNIVWANRGNDGFEIFNNPNLPPVTPGLTNAQVARNVVDAAIVSWERVIDNFNQLRAFFDPIGDPNRIDVRISMNTGGVGHGGGASGFVFDRISHPIAGTISLRRGNDLDFPGDGVGDGGGWFLDPTPFDSSEFTGTIINAFVGAAAGASPAFGQIDLYSVVLHELGHVIGLSPLHPLMSAPSQGTVTNTGIADDADGEGVGQYFVFDGPSVTHLMTSNNGGPDGLNAGAISHSAGPGGASQPIAFTSAFRGQRQLFGSRDLMNAVLGESLGQNDVQVSTRSLVSDVVSLILKDAYSYTVDEPQRFGTFYALWNQTTGNLLVRGAPAVDTNGVVNNSNDVITLRQESGQLVVSVDIGRDVPGTNPSGDNSNSPAWVTRFPFEAVTSITIQTGQGSDEVTLDFTGGDVIPAGGISYDGGSGGGSGLNQIRAVGNVNSFLTTNALQVGSFGSVALNFVQYAILVGGPSANTLSVNGWQGTVELRGAGSGDNYQITLNSVSLGTYVNQSAT